MRDLRVKYTRAQKRSIAKRYLRGDDPRKIQDTFRIPRVSYVSIYARRFAEELNIPFLKRVG